MLPLPERPENANVRALAGWTRERFTGLTTAVVVTTDNIVQGTELVFKNGTLVDPSSYAVAGKTVTLGGALIAGDWVAVSYYARSS